MVISCDLYSEKSTGQSHPNFQMSLYVFKQDPTLFLTEHYTSLSGKSSISSHILSIKKLQLDFLNEFINMTVQINDVYHKVLLDTKKGNL